MGAEVIKPRNVVFTLILPATTLVLGSYLSSLYSLLTLFRQRGRGFVGPKKKTIVGLLLFRPLWLHTLHSYMLATHLNLVRKKCYKNTRSVCSYFPRECETILLLPKQILKLLKLPEVFYFKNISVLVQNFGGDANSWIFCGMQIKAFSWKAYSLLSIIASCSRDFPTHRHLTKRKLQINILRDREDWTLRGPHCPTIVFFLGPCTKPLKSYG